MPGLVLAEDGKLEDVSERRVLGTLSRAGRFVDPSGKLVAQLTPDGEIEASTGDVLPVTIAADGTVNMLKEGRKIRLLDDGALEGANPTGPAIKFSGVTPATRRAAMFVLVLASFPVQPKP